ncbi:PhzF family phenazine biosynthesis protein [Streptomyces sp. NPDC015127]|uniref:PhzF family phenazine biosynthesis protein n=1 Tax=Streptomyces sp. NPDC015127 TaxID=3364939 RepID=UPI0037028099
MAAKPADILHYTAFSDDPNGGNPAGVVIDSSSLHDADMLVLAARLGYSETAFLSDPPIELADVPGRVFTIRYFSPKIEVPFCGHATVAASIAIAERIGPGHLTFATKAGIVPVTVAEMEGALRATLTSVPARVYTAAAADINEALSALDWTAEELDPALPPRIAFAGARHLVLSARTRVRLATLSYDFNRLASVMQKLNVVTVHLVWRETPTTFHVRNPFPVGGVVEDPATGAAAAAFGAYARELALVPEESELTLHQGHDMGRPSLLTVTLKAGDSRVQVTGSGSRIPA